MSSTPPTPPTSPDSPSKYYAMPIINIYKQANYAYDDYTYDDTYDTYIKLTLPNNTKN